MSRSSASTTSTGPAATTTTASTGPAASTTSTGPAATNTTTSPDSAASAVLPSTDSAATTTTTLAGPAPSTSSASAPPKPDDDTSAAPSSIQRSWPEFLRGSWAGPNSGIAVASTAVVPIAAFLTMWQNSVGQLVGAIPMGREFLSMVSGILADMIFAVCFGQPRMNWGADGLFLFFAKSNYRFEFESWARQSPVQFLFTFVGIAAVALWSVKRIGQGLYRTFIAPRPAA